MASTLASTTSQQPVQANLPAQGSQPIQTQPVQTSQTQQAGSSSTQLPAQQPPTNPPQQTSTQDMSSVGGSKFPTPDSFNGKADELTGGSKAREFLTKCDIYISVYNTAFPGDRDKARLVLFLCKDAAYAWAAPWIKALTDGQHPLHADTGDWGTSKRPSLLSSAWSIKKQQPLESWLNFVNQERSRNSPPSLESLRRKLNGMMRVKSLSIA